MTTDTVERLIEIPVDQIRPNPLNPRGTVDPESVCELANSIEQVGLIQPVVVMETGDGYVLLAGERRWTAVMKLMLWETIPAVVVEERSEAGQIEWMLTENQQRRDLGPVDEAKGIASLVKLGCSQRVVAQRLGCDQSHVSRRLELLKLPELTQQSVNTGKMAVSHALATLKPKKESKPAAASVEPVGEPAGEHHPAAEAPDPVGFKVLLREYGTLTDTWDAAIFPTADAACIEAAEAKCQEFDPVVVALVPLSERETAMLANPSKTEQLRGAIGQAEAGKVAPYEPVEERAGASDEGAEPVVTQVTGFDSSTIDHPVEMTIGKPGSSGIREVRCQVHAVIGHHAQEARCRKIATDHLATSHGGAGTIRDGMV